ncbi:Methyltransferase domain-containing protein [Amycolatopsis pretoriensis]|uniref:Methyltransferase domain-containing protein n=1 Tax=Amycolatopsis pretoriensis TaxID=218821 RepID=A0A1H5RLX3_9PSEU|nr:class I SAM-dependent methyltransferase [Amycolatopsis pretoriensis]SEF38501.1 Methyltransferase domain-containing protein [Amycolatopsis pretoriensis]
MKSLTKTESAWKIIPGPVYEDAVYRSPLLLSVFEHELALIRGRVTPSICVVEVGCGTGKFCLTFADDARMTVGVDVSRHFLDLLMKHSSPARRLFAVEGNAANLREVLADDRRLDSDYHESPKLFACVMNTLGIMPEQSRREVVREMCASLSPDDSLLLTVFNREFFGQAVREFYAAHPELCGVIEPGDVDSAKAELHVRSTGYFSHWFSEAELSELVTSTGLKRIHISTEGPGLHLTSGPMFQNIE